MMYFILAVSLATLALLIYFVFYRRNDNGRAILKQVNELKAQIDYFVSTRIPDSPTEVGYKGRVIRKTDEEVYKKESKDATTY